MKSQERAFVLGAWDSMSKDILSTYPELRRSIHRDMVTLAHQLEHRGFGFLTLDLPLLDDLLLQGLEEASLPTCFYLFSSCKKARVPKLFQGLWLKVFDRSGCLLEEADVTAIFFLRSLACMWKKLERKCSDHRLRKAINEYQNIEHELQDPSLNWGESSLSDPYDANRLPVSFVEFCCSGANISNVSGEQPEHTDIGSDDIYSIRESLKALDAVSRRFCNELPFFDPFSASTTKVGAGQDRRWGCPDPDEVWTGSAFRHGPGAVADASFRNIDKFNFPSWSKRLSEVFPYFPFGSTSYHRIKDIPSDRDVPSNLIAVPKTQKSPRLIASEPTANQWCQQHIAGYFYRTTRFFRFIVDTKDQKVSRSMVLTASATGHLATIDLSSASDRLSCRVVERIFQSRPDILDALNAVRSSSVSNRIDKTDYFLLKSKKYASQGTACTFPVQSICFALIALAACGYKDWKHAKGKVRVFGDDIIVPVDKVHRVMSLLHCLGLKVNENKSFSKGYFRESCGMDAYRGIDVTPHRFVQLPKSSKTSVLLSMLDYSNNLHKKGLWNLADFTRKHAHSFGKTKRVSNEADDNSALYSFSGSSESHLRVRYNDDLQKKEVRVVTLINVATPKGREPLPRLMYNQHSDFGESFSPLINGRPKLVKVWKWEDSRTV